MKKNALIWMGLALCSASAQASFIDVEAFNTKNAIAPPPAKGSEKEKDDFERLFESQKKRKIADCKRALSEVHPSLEAFFGKPYGTLSEQEIERLTPFFDEIQYDVDSIVQRSKKDWMRPRPFVARKKLTLCDGVKRETTAAYPSGHGAISLAFARTLSRIYPRQAFQLMRRATQIGNDRVLAGVHHPSDIEAGRALAEKVMVQIEESPRFKAGLEKLMIRDK